MSYFTLSPSHQQTGKLLEQIREMNKQGITPENIKDALTKKNSVELVSLTSDDGAKAQEDTNEHKSHQQKIDLTHKDTTDAGSVQTKLHDEFSEVNSDVVNEI